MSSSWLEDLLPRGAVSPRNRIFWLLFFALFPLAYIGGVLLELQQELPARLESADSRASAIRIAEEFAASKGYDVAGWRQYAVARTRDDLLAYYNESKQPGISAARGIAPPRELEVLFRTPDQSHEFRVYLSLRGQVTGYEFGKSAKEEKQDSDDEVVHVSVNPRGESTDDKPADKESKPLIDRQSEAVARREMEENGALSGLVQMGAAKVRSNSDDSMRRDVTWDENPAGNPDLTLHISVSVRDSQVVAEHVVGMVSSDHAPKKPKLPIVFGVLYGFFLAFGAVYAMYRYAKRTLQKEVSHLRTLVVAGIFCVSYAMLAYSLGMDQIAVVVSGETFTKIEIIGGVASVVLFAIMGLLVGIAYGSGEGELREAYPGKLTSLDALLAGRILSRNVAASLLFGAAAAGWLLLCHHALGHFLQSDPTAARNDAMRYTYARLPYISLWLGKQYDSLLVAVAGLLLPAAFLMRTKARKKRRFAWLIVFAMFSVLLHAARYTMLAPALLAMAVFVAALLVPFFAFDLLAAIVSLSVLSFVNEVVRLGAVVQVWDGFAAWLAVAATVALALAVYLALRGRPVREEDVRPLYARNLAERMALQAEVLAAREAQLRLLPQVAPELPGIEFAACCLPAREVGGDFYDFFRLDANRVGIFIAQGSEDGLASALCIALAKGVLMHASLQSQSPVQILLQLESTIAELLERGSGRGISFAYGVMDTRRNVMNYARLGTSPRLVIYRQGTGVAASSQLESAVNAPNRAESAPQISEGAAHVQPGDHLIFFTGGVTSLRTRRLGKREYQWLDFLMSQLKPTEEPLQALLVAALSKHQSHASKDLTAVVLQVSEIHAMAQEVVA